MKKLAKTASIRVGENQPEDALTDRRNQGIQMTEEEELNPNEINLAIENKEISLKDKIIN